MATFNWSIANTERYLDTGGVFVVHWRVTAEETVGDVTYTASSYGTVGFTPDPDASDFVAYDSLTEADVLGWVHESVDKDATEAAIADKIDAMANPVTVSGTPW